MTPVRDGNTTDLYAILGQMPDSPATAALLGVIDMHHPVGILDDRGAFYVADDDTDPDECVQEACAACHIDQDGAVVGDPENGLWPCETYQVMARHLGRSEAEEWNIRHPVGTLVRYWPSFREGDGRESATRTPAWTLGSGTAVVSVEDYAGGIALTHVEPDRPDGPTVERIRLAAMLREHGQHAAAYLVKTHVPNLVCGMDCEFLKEEAGADA